jgi:hypothetical protein
MSTDIEYFSTFYDYSGLQLQLESKVVDPEEGLQPAGNLPRENLSRINKITVY